MRHPLEARDSGTAFTTRQDIPVSGNQNCLKIEARGRNSPEAFRFGAKGKDRASRGLLWIGTADYALKFRFDAECRTSV